MMQQAKDAYVDLSHAKNAHHHPPSGQSVWSAAVAIGAAWSAASSCSY